MPGMAHKRTVHCNRVPPCADLGVAARVGKGHSSQSRREISRRPFPSSGKAKAEPSLQAASCPLFENREGWGNLIYFGGKLSLRLRCGFIHAASEPLAVLNQTHPEKI